MENPTRKVCPACQDENFILVRDDFQGYVVEGNALKGYVRYERRCQVYRCQHCKNEEVNFKKLEVERLSERDKWATLIDSLTVGLLVLGLFLFVVGGTGVAAPFIILGVGGLAGAIAWHRILDQDYKTRNIDREPPETHHQGRPPA